MAQLNDAEELRTLELYQFIRDYIDENSISPSLGEISKACLMSKGNLPIHLGRLEGWAWIERQYRIPRSIRLGEKAPSAAETQKLIEQKRGKLS